jgi:hypothetical protein
VISFRYLVVTVISIFLALGLGVLAGTTVIDQSIVKTLKRQQQTLERRVAATEKKINQTGAYLDLAEPWLVESRLAGQQVVLVTDANADGNAVAEARDYLGKAGATIVTELNVPSTLAPNNPATQQLQQVLATNGVSASASDVIPSTARALADRLQQGPPQQPAAGSTAKPPHDLLADLLNGGYLDFPHNSPPNPQVVGGSGQIVVVVAGGNSDPAVAYDAFMVPLVEQLVHDRVPAAAAEPMDALHPFVGFLRDDPAIPSGSSLVTVDDLSPDLSFGGVALVLGLKELIRFGRGGDYGLKGVTNIIPPVP